MKVKTAELKAKLSMYLRQLRETGEPIEIILREGEEPVAYLTPYHGSSKQRSPSTIVEQANLRAAFAHVGLTYSVKEQPLDSLPKPSPVLAGDGKTKVNSVQSIRSQKDW